MTPGPLGVALVRPRRKTTARSYSLRTLIPLISSKTRIAAMMRTIRKNCGMTARYLVLQWSAMT